MEIVQRAEKIELFALLLVSELWIFDVGEELVDAHVRCDHAGSLELRRKKAIAPQCGADDDFRAGPQDDIARKILVFGAETVQKPGTHRWADGLDIAGVHLNERGLMVRHVGSHRADHTAVVDHLADMRKSYADLDAALAALLEGELRRHETAALGLL